MENKYLKYVLTGVLFIASLGIFTKATIFNTSGEESLAKATIVIQVPKNQRFIFPHGYVQVARETTDNQDKYYLEIYMNNRELVERQELYREKDNQGVMKKPVLYINNILQEQLGKTIVVGKSIQTYIEPTSFRENASAPGGYLTIEWYYSDRDGIIPDSRTTSGYVKEKVIINRKKNFYRDVAIHFRDVLGDMGSIANHNQDEYYLDSTTSRLVLANTLNTIISRQRMPTGTYKNFTIQKEVKANDNLPNLKKIPTNLYIRRVKIKEDDNTYRFSASEAVSVDYQEIGKSSLMLESMEKGGSFLTKTYDYPIKVTTERENLTGIITKSTITDLQGKILYVFTFSADGYTM